MKRITDGESIVLRAGELRAEVLTPWSARYRRPRFHHSALVSKVWLGDECFTTMEETPDGRNFDCGMGLCCEYKAPAFDENVPPGDPWLKPGVGVLTRGAQPWNFRDETLCDGLPTELNADESSANFVCETPCVGSYAYREERTLTLREQSIRLSVQFTNTGERPWDMNEYSHNFLSLNGRKTDCHTHLVLPTVRMTAQAANEAGVIQTWHGIDWADTKLQSFLLRFPQVCDASFAWLLYRDDCPVCVEERLSEAPVLMQLWGDETRLCPEAFVQVHVLPGETKSWYREWHFQTGKKEKE